MEDCTAGDCGKTLADYKRVVQDWLPKGRLWSMENEDRCFTRFWCCVADAFTAAENELCCYIRGAVPCSEPLECCGEQAELDECQPLGLEGDKSLLERWAEITRFPVDCVELTDEKLCEWMSGAPCRAGTYPWLQWLIDFVGLDGVTVKVQPNSVAIGCHKIGYHAIACGPGVTICGCDLEIPPTPCIGDATMKNALGNCEPVCPKIEALRWKYFPAGLAVNYEA